MIKMHEGSKMPTTTGIKGAATMNVHSKEQCAAIDAFLPWIEEAIVRLTDLLGYQTSIVILDIGSAEGGYAIYAMNRLTNKLRCVSDLPIHVLFDDLPTTDFNRLLANLFPGGKIFIHPTEE